jgi:hypothetical protein
MTVDSDTVDTVDTVDSDNDCSCQLEIHAQWICFAP